MSKNYEFLAMLDLTYSKENILSLLKIGAESGCNYKYYYPGSSEISGIINSESACEFIWSQFLENSEFGPIILIKYHNKFFCMWLFNKNNKISLHIDYARWKKRYDLCDWYGIHFYRYQKFILNFIGNTTITHLETYEWFETAYYPENKESDKKIYVKFYIYWPYDIYHHFKVNSHILGMTWLDTHSQPINLKQEDNTLENILYHEDTTQCWYGIKDDIKLKFTLHNKRYFIVEPMHNSPSSDIQLNQKQLFNDGLRITIELFKNMPVVRFITFQEDKDIEAINTMDEQ